MTARPGERKGNELWLRCPHCGDSSKSPDKAHYSVNSEGKFHCLRCKAGGRLPLRDYLAFVYQDNADLIPDVDTLVDWEEVLDDIQPGSAYPRGSALDRYHITTPHHRWDVFLSRNVKGEILGLCLSDLENHKRMVIGKVLLGWQGDTLLSSPTSPLRLVEGPYDVLSERDVCTFGLPARSHLKALRGHTIVLCPDGDVWPDHAKRSTILRLLNNEHAEILGVEFLPDGMDPDEVPYDKRKFINKKDIKHSWLTNQRLRRLIAETQSW